MVNLIREQYATYYFANKCSGAFIFCAFLYLIMILLPFLIGFTTRDFWILKKVALQTPRVSSTDEYLLKILLSDGSQKIYTNVQEIGLALASPQLGAFYFTQQQISIDEQDVLQAKASNFTAQFMVDLMSEATLKKIREIQIMLFYQYNLDETVNMKMKGHAFASLKSPHGIQTASVIGLMRLQQRHPIYSGSTPRTKYNYSSYYNPLGQILTDPVEMIENTLYNRNESIHYDYITYIVPAPTSTETTTTDTTTDTTTTNTTNTTNTTTTTTTTTITYLPTQLNHTSRLLINMTLQIPLKEQVMYQTQLIESLKFSWMQYLSIFLIFWFFGSLILEFVVKNKVFATQAIVNITLEQPTYSKLKLD